MNQAKKHLILAGIMMSMLVGGASAQLGQVVLVGDLTSYDTPWIDFIVNNLDRPSTVTYIEDRYQTLDATKVAELENADLIVMTRNAVSSGYDDPISNQGATPWTEDENAFWARVPTPIAMFSHFVARTGAAGNDPRWHWINSNAGPAAGVAPGSQPFDRITILPGRTTDTLFAGVTINGNNEVMIFPTADNQTLRATQAGGMANTNGEYLAATPNATATGIDLDRPTIIRFSSTTVPYHGATTLVPGAKRIFFGVFDDTAGQVPGGASGDQLAKLTPDGRRIFKNILNELMPAAPVNEVQQWTVFN